MRIEQTGSLFRFQIILALSSSVFAANTQKKRQPDELTPAGRARTPQRSNRSVVESKALHSERKWQSLYMETKTHVTAKRKSEEGSPRCLRRAATPAASHTRRPNHRSSIRLVAPIDRAFADILFVL